MFDGCVWCVGWWICVPITPPVHRDQHPTHPPSDHPTNKRQPQQVEAATSIKTLAMLPGVEPLFVPHLEGLLRQYFRLLNEARKNIYTYVYMCVFVS